MDPAILNALRARQPAARPPVQPQNPLAGLLTNPGVVQAGLDKNQALMDANSALRQQRSQALVGFGSPQLANQLGSAVDPNTAAAAGANQYSTLAGLSHQNELGIRNLMNNLAGRRAVHSGDLGYQQGEQARAFGQANYDATQQLLSQLSGYLNQFLGTSQNANQGYTNALLQAFGQYGSNPLGLYR